MSSLERLKAGTDLSPIFDAIDAASARTHDADTALIAGDFPAALEQLKRAEVQAGIVVRWLADARVAVEGMVK